MKIQFAKHEMPTAGALAVAVADERKLAASATLADRLSKGAVGRALAVSRFKGRADELLQILAPGELKLDRVLLYGVGAPATLDPLVAEAIGGRLVAHANGVGETSLSIAIDPISGSKVGAAEFAARVAQGARLRSYRFDKYRTKEKPEQKPSVKKLTIMVEDPAAAKRAYEPLERLADGIVFTRDLVAEPANVIYPESLAAAAKQLARLGVEVEVLGEAQMKKLGMGALLGVGQGSERDSRLVVMQWNGLPASRKKPPVAFIGKGVTFDTGGISIKPAAGMEEMKWDMGGAGAVIGAMKALAGRKAKANVVGVVGLVENMPSGTAQRPGDVVRSMSGQTIEVINTDAEGRLVLADALWYTQQRFKPQLMIDLATLTGAIMVALGQVQAGLFSNNDQLAERLLGVGRAEGELLWRMPLGDAYDKLINSDIADVKNVGGRYGGSITAAQFLQRFVNNTPWAHLDIAGMAWSDKDAPTVPKGATGYGIRILNRLVAQHYEER
ncbi:MAG: leucyl aminopeptidase [Dongiaceae bacterium]